MLISASDAEGYVFHWSSHAHDPNSNWSCLYDFRDRSSRAPTWWKSTQLFWAFWNPAERHLDLGHLRMWVPGFAQLVEILRDNLRPGFVAICKDVILVGNVNGARRLGAARIHERVGPVDLRGEVAWLQCQRLVARTECLGRLSGQQRLPGKGHQLVCRVFAGLSFRLYLLGLNLGQNPFLHCQRVGIAAGRISRFELQARH